MGRLRQNPERATRRVAGSPASAAKAARTCRSGSDRLLPSAT
jgi:hypothetical protein